MLTALNFCFSLGSLIPCMNIVPPGNLLGICNLIKKNVQKNVRPHLNIFAWQKCSNIFLNIFCLFAGYIWFQPMCASFPLGRWIHSPTWTPPLIHQRHHHHQSVAYSQLQLRAASKEPVDDQSHKGRQQAGKGVGNHRAGRARNNQPLMGAAKAGGGWQRDQEDDVWKLAMKEDGCRPVMTRSNDGTPLGGGEGVQLLSLGVAPGRHLWRPILMAALGGCIWWWRRRLMASVMENDEAMLRRQRQREAGTDSRHNNQIKTTVAAAAAGGGGGRTHVMAAIDDGGNGQQWGGGKQGRQRQLGVLSVPSRQTAGW
jgi:hypothetical protein